MSDILEEKQLRQNGIEFYPIIKKDSYIKQYSNNAVTSDAVYNYIKNYGSNLTKLDSQSSTYTINDVILTLNQILSIFGAKPYLGKRKAFILACSDYQTNSDSANDKDQNLKNLLTSVNSYIDYNDIDVNSVFVCGDYSGAYDSAQQSGNGLKELIEIFKSYDKLHIEDDEFVIVQGNHDRAASVDPAYSSLFSKTGKVSNGSGEDKFDDFGIFVINELDFPTECGSGEEDEIEAMVKTLSDYLADFLRKKSESNYKKPIFILSHVPLHYTMRTYNYGDSRFADHIFSVLYMYSYLGLDIYFLFGHNHSNGWDDYVGGARVYIEPGEEIRIAKLDNKNEYNSYICNFTYLNAGYIGYYSTPNEDSGADKLLTMTAYEIYEHGVVIKRFSEDGHVNIEGIHIPKGTNVPNSD